jgi:hypothetical protein
MKRRGLRLLIALGVGGGLVGLAAVLVRVTRVHDFYAVCLVIGLIAIGLAVAALVSPNVLLQRATGDPYFGESYTPADDVSFSEDEHRSVGWYSLYLILAAMPCLLTALIHYWT